MESRFHEEHFLYVILDVKTNHFFFFSVSLQFVWYFYAFAILWSKNVTSPDLSMFSKLSHHHTVSARLIACVYIVENPSAVGIPKLVHDTADFQLATPARLWKRIEMKQ